MPQQLAFPDSTAHREYIAAFDTLRFPVEGAVAFPLVTVPECFDFTTMFIGHLGYEGKQGKG